MDCENLCGSGSGGIGDMDGISMRDVVECLRGVSHEELLSNLESIGFHFNEQDIIRQMNRMDSDAKRRIMRNAGVY